MRLLSVKRDASSGNTPTYNFSLTYFSASSIPPVYAILSHRWGEDEVLFKDLENGTASQREGYKKLTFCAERVAHDGISYFWVDTCCIDKTSSAELTEAINSMYKWYQKATKCYVYMPDVLMVDGTGAPLAESEWQSAFQSSTWFTRGWTLQELIAPTVVEFFSAEGEVLGDKITREQRIHEITGVPIEALRGDVSRFDVKERLSWAASRQTSVEEDAVYCLLGLVDVHMPLIYGEGRQKAMVRLQRELQMSSVPTASVQDINPSVPEAQSHTRQKTNEDMFCQQTPARDVMDWEGFLRSLSYPEMEYRYYNVDDAQSDTCSWLLNHSHYQKWHDQAGPNDLLMIRGKPGSGKSTAMKRACILARENAPANEAVIAYFFNSRGVDMETKLEGFFRSMLHQVLESGRCTDEESFKEWRRKNSSIKSGWTWTVAELRSMFIRCVSRATVKITMFVDALDECESESTARDLMAILAKFGRNDDSCQLRPKICVSSRHYPNVGVAEPLQITVEESNRVDISKYTWNTLQGQTKDFKDLTNKITLRSNGVFLWALLVLERIRAAVENGEPRSRLHSIIDLVPQRLEELFQQLIDSTPVDEREQRDLIILWVLFAECPLTLSELNHALAFKIQRPSYSHYADDFVQPDQMKRVLANRTRGLVEAVEINDRYVDSTKTFRVQFIHESVRQYVLKQRDVVTAEQHSGPSGVGSAHNVLALSCFNYIKVVCVEPEVIQSFVGPPVYEISGSERRRREQAQQDRPFLEYATRFAFNHAEVAEANGFPQSYLIESKTGDDAGSGLWWNIFAHVFKQESEFPWGRFDDSQWDRSLQLPKEYTAIQAPYIAPWSEYTTTPLAFACAFKLISWIRYLLRNTQLNPSELDLSRALCVTATCGGEETLALLLQAGADLNHREPTVGTPLYLSLASRQFDVAAFLIRHGASVHMREQKHSPLVIATRYGPMEVVRLLISHGAKITECDHGWPFFGHGRHAIEAAIKREDCDIMQTIIDAAESEQVQVEYYKTAFVSAQLSGKIQQAETLKVVVSRLFTGHKTIIVFVKFLNGQTVTVETWEDTIIHTLRYMIKPKKSGIRMRSMTLEYGSRVLEDLQTLCYYNIIHDSTIRVTRRA